MAMERDVCVLAWSPLGGGRLGDPQDDHPAATSGRGKALDAVARDTDVRQPGGGDL